jgi:hypothetical protein
VSVSVVKVASKKLQVTFVEHPETRASKSNSADSDPAPILSARKGDLLGILDERERNRAKRTRQAVNSETPDPDGEYPKPPIFSGERIQRGIASSIVP